MRVVIADDEALARDRLKRFLKDIPGSEVVGEAAEGGRAIALCQEQQPDVVLLDIRMPGMDGLEAARHLITLEEPPAIIFTTAYGDYAPAGIRDPGHRLSAQAHSQGAVGAGAGACRKVLEKVNGFQVIGVASNGREAVEEAIRLRPAVVVMDIAMPDMNGVEATRQIMEKLPGTRVLILSMYLSAEHIHRSLDTFGLADPLIINTDDRLIGGHQRKRILLSNGANAETLVDVRVPSRPLTDREAEELAIRLNKNSGDWDFDLLANGFDVPDLLDWGFTEEELQIGGFTFADKPEDRGAQMDKAEELREKWGVELGQLWQLGDHR